MSVFVCQMVLALVLGVFVARRMSRRMRLKSRAGKVAWGVFVVLMLAYGSMKTLVGPSGPQLDAPQMKDPGSPLAGGGLTNEVPPGFWAWLPPGWYVALGLSTNDVDGDGVCCVWERRVFSDPLVFDSLADRCGDGLTDLEEFILGTDPRAASTSGGIIDDGWLVRHGLDPLEVWDDVEYAPGVTYEDLYVRGWSPGSEVVTNLQDWLERGLDPEVDEWIAWEDAPGDVTRVSVRVTGAASACAVVACGPIRHVGPAPKVYALRSGRRYDVSVAPLHGAQGLEGVVEILPVEGMITFTTNYTHAFTLGGASPSPVPQGGGGMMLMSAPLEEEIPPVHTWRLEVLAMNEGCIHGRLKLVARVQKGGLGLFAQEPGEYAWQWRDGDPFGVVCNLSPGLAEVRISKTLAGKWVDKYGNLSTRALGCAFTPEGAGSALKGDVGLSCCGASALPDWELWGDEGECVCPSDQTREAPNRIRVRGCLCRQDRSIFEACEECQQGAAACDYCYETVVERAYFHPGHDCCQRCGYCAGCGGSAVDCVCSCHQGGGDGDGDCEGEDGHDPDHPPRKTQKNAPWRRGCLLLNNNDDLRLGREDLLSTDPSVKNNMSDEDILDARLGEPQCSECCPCRAHNEDYEFAILSIHTALRVYDALGNLVSGGAVFSEWRRLFVEGVKTAGIATPCQIIYREFKTGPVITNDYVVGRVSLFGDTNDDTTLDMTDFWDWPHDGLGYVSVPLTAHDNDPPESLPLSPWEAQMLPKVGLGLWMEDAPTGHYELRVEGGGVFEVWQNWGGAWQLLTVSTNTHPALFYHVPGVETRQVSIRCRVEGEAWLSLSYCNFQNPQHDYLYGATLLLRGYDPLAMDSDNNNGFGPPDRTEAEVLLKNRPNTPGKIILVNDGDIDRDNIIDYFDGFSLLPGADYAQSPGVRFVPVEITVPPDFELREHLLRVRYNGSHPGYISFDSDGLPILNPGRLRLWKQDGGTARNPASHTSNGDYLSPDEPPCSAYQYGFNPETRVLTFYLEAVNPSETLGDESLTLEIYHPTDYTPPRHISTARLTAFKPLIKPDMDGNGTLNDEDKQLLKIHKDAKAPCDALYAPASNVFHRVDLVVSNAPEEGEQHVLLMGVQDAFNIYTDTNQPPVAVSSPEGTLYTLTQSTTTDDTTLWLECLKPSAGLLNRINASCAWLQVSGKRVDGAAMPAPGLGIGVAVRQGGDNGIKRYRIPGIVTTPKGTLLAVYDTRRSGPRDLPADIDFGLSRSTDGGQTWEPMRIVLDMGAWGGLPKKFNGVSDACILVDDRAGAVLVAGLWMHGVLDQNGRWTE
ncbi:MAG: glycoside hydrolase, partial [Kiritimatiellaeota bacterium]|nr:glycoside hydrolase [Kiritimatiellota bacterium]